MSVIVNLHAYGSKKPRTNRGVKESPTSTLPLVFLNGPFGQGNVIFTVVEYTGIITPAACNSEHGQTEASEPCVLVLQALCPLSFERRAVK